MLSKEEQDFVNGLRVCRFGSIDERGFPHIVPLIVSAMKHSIEAENFKKEIQTLISSE